MSVGSLRFRARDYSEEEAAASLPRSRAENHPLATRPSSHQVNVEEDVKIFFDDPLRAPTWNPENSSQNAEPICATALIDPCSEPSQQSSKEWAVFKRSLMQKFSSTHTVSTALMSEAVHRSGKVLEKSLASVHLEELDEPEKSAKEEEKVLTRQEYLSKLNELKEEIGRAWRVDDRVTALKLSIKVARLMMDTSVLQFYPIIFVLVADVMDMLGELVWDRIRRKAEYSDNEYSISCLPENFKVVDVCSDAKETCNNWFCKIGSIRELLPRIYLELSILHCWRFLQDSYMGTIRRLTMMMRGIADPLASAYCHLYMAHCAQKLPISDMGFLNTSINDISTMLTRIISTNESSHNNSYENKKILFSIIEPTVEWIMKCIFKGRSKLASDIFVELGLRKNMSKSTENIPCISIILYHLLKQLPADIVSINALEILQLVESSKDISLHQYLNFRELGVKLSTSKPPMDAVEAILHRIFLAGSELDDLNKYLKVADTYLDIILQCQMDDHLVIILDGISTRTCDKLIPEDESDSLQSILDKILNHFIDLEDVLSLNHFVEILYVMHGSSRNMVSMHIVTKATRNGYIHDPTIIRLLLEISQDLHDSIDFSSIKRDENQQPAQLISRFVSKVDFGADLEQHLTFLLECRSTFGGINEIKETLVHSCNYLAIKAIASAENFLGFIKSCIAFNEVTIPAISAITVRLKLYLETAEVSLLGGLVSHTDGLIDSAISTLLSVELSDGSSEIDVGGLLSLTQKLCSFLVMVPGNYVQGIMHAPMNLVSLVNPQSWTTPMSRSKTFFAILCLSATLSQFKLPYHAKNGQVMGNDQLFLGESSYTEELVSISSFVLQNLVDSIQQEPSQVTRGNLALEACNCIVSSFEASHEISLIFFQLIEIAKSCLPAKNKYLQVTLNFSSKYLAIERDVQVASDIILERELATSFPLQ